jgi:lipid-A-disaccharide synthase
MEALPRQPELNGHPPTIGLFPGSRRHEVLDLLGVLQGSAAIIERTVPAARFVICSANEMAARLIREHVKNWSTPVEVVHRQSHRVLAGCDLLLTCSGTATLEAAILGVPMVVMYRLHHWVDRIIQSSVLRMLDYPYFSLPNYLLNRAVVPELRNEHANPGNVAGYGLALLSDPARRRDACAGLAEVRALLGRPGAIARAADLVEEILDGRPSTRLRVSTGRTRAVQDVSRPSLARIPKVVGI